MKRGGQAFVGDQRRVVLKMPMTSLTGLSMGPERTEVTGVLIVYDCWKQLVITAYPCVAPLRFIQPDEDDGWISSQNHSSCFLTASLRANQIFKKEMLKTVYI